MRVMAVVEERRRRVDWVVLAGYKPRLESLDARRETDIMYICVCVLWLMEENRGSGETEVTEVPMQGRLQVHE